MIFTVPQPCSLVCTARPEVLKERIPRVSRLMALAIRFDELIKSGQIKSQSELADLGHVSRARVSQIMRLLDLAPDIQEEILFLGATDGWERE